MKAILGDFGGTVHRYKFFNAGRSDTGEAAGEPAGLSSPSGDTYNIAGIVPGADHPEQEVIVSGHYDFTDAAHAAAWDSSEGHAEVIRIAKLMTDYRRATGTRPAVTVKFMPWAAEESGTYGSQDYVTNYVATRLDAPAFGGKRALTVSVTTTRAAKVTISVFRGAARRAVRKLTRSTTPNRLLKVRFAPRKLERGLYRIVIAAAGGGATQSATLYSTKY
jgi:hypothetical protein